tara:strand:+ start:136 stop:1644 length:1509 start_codon:yes stop_codon:yes gene_type:complete
MAINYGPSTALIQGAAKAYKDYSNVPGMYEGIDKVIKVGTDMADKAIKEQEARKLQEEKDAKAAKDKRQAQEKAWRAATQDVYNNAGSFKSQTDYNFTFDKLNKIKEDLIKAQDNNDQEGIAAANLALNEEKAYIDDMVALRKQFAEMDKSAAMSNSDNPYDGNDGRALDIITAWMNEEYEVDENEKGERVFNIKIQGATITNTYSLTKQELEDMYIPQVPEASAKFFEIKDDLSGKRNFDRNSVEASVKSNLPQDTNGLRAFIADPIGNQTFSEMLDSDKSIRAEVDPFFDTDGGGISDKEFKTFKEAIVDPYHSLWKDENGNIDVNKWEQYCRPIVIEKLSNSIENQHKINFPPAVETPKKGDFPPAVEEGGGTSIYNDPKSGGYVDAQGNEVSVNPEFASEFEEKSSEKKPAGPIAQQMLDEKYSSGNDVFNMDELRSALASGNVSEEILTKYLSEIPGVTIENGVAKGLDQRGFKFSTAFNKAMRKLQNEENINLGYK